MDYFILSINLIEYMKLFVYQNNWNLISIANIHMQELKKIRCKFMGKRIKLRTSRVTYIDCYNLNK